MEEVPVNDVTFELPKVVSSGKPRKPRKNMIVRTYNKPSRTEKQAMIGAAVRAQIGDELYIFQKMTDNQLGVKKTFLSSFTPEQAALGLHETKKAYGETWREISMEVRKKIAEANAANKKITIIKKSGKPRVANKFNLPAAYNTPEFGKFKKDSVNYKKLIMAAADEANKCTDPANPFSRPGNRAALNRALVNMGIKSELLVSLRGKKVGRKPSKKLSEMRAEKTLEEAQAFKARAMAKRKATRRANMLKAANSVMSMKTKQF